MGTFPRHVRGLGGWPKHWSPLIQINFIKHSLGLWDGWPVNQVLTGREKRSPASRCSWPQLMALLWKLSKRKLCCGHEDSMVPFSGSFRSSLQIGRKPRYMSMGGIAMKTWGNRKGSILARTHKYEWPLPLWVHFVLSVKVIVHNYRVLGTLIKIIYILTFYTYSRW